MRVARSFVICVILTSCASNQDVDRIVTRNDCFDSYHDSKYIEAMWFYSTGHLLFKYGDSRDGDGLPVLDSMMSDGNFQHRRVASESDIAQLDQIRKRLSATIVVYWPEEEEDKEVLQKDMDAVKKRIDRFYSNPEVRSSLFSPCQDLESCQSVRYKFLRKTRCYVKITHYDYGPLNSAGVDVYLLKINGKWEILTYSKWIS